jgi:V/A-type H+-transporting ATPase subunit I
MTSIIVNTPEPMVNMKVVTVKEDSGKTLKILQGIGVIHIEENDELEPVDRTAIEGQQKEVNELLSSVNRILGYLPQATEITLDEDIEVIYTRPFAEIGDEIKKIYNKTGRLHDRIVTIDENLLTLSGYIKYLRPLAEKAGLNLKDLNYTGNFLISRVYGVPSEAYENVREALKEYATENLVADMETETVVHIVAEARHRENIEAAITGAGGQIISFPDEDRAAQDFIKVASETITSLESEKEQLTGELSNEVGEDLKKLVLLREALVAENDRLLVLEKASEARYITVLVGWLPENDAEDATAEIKEKLDYVYIDVRKPASDEEPPTKYRNPGGFKPFQIIVNLFATPKYREWDPTPVVTYSFALFFGLMVCDVLYALGLILLSRFALRKFVDDPTTDGFRQFQRLLYTCAGVALVGGLLTGQYFGNIYEFFGIENLAIVKGIQEAFQDPVTFIIIALAIGFVHVNIGHIIALVKAVKDRDNGVIIGKVGLLVLQLGLPTILHSMMGLEIPGFSPQVYSILSYMLLAGVVLIIVSSIMVSKGLGAILWLFDITGLLGDVMSYARLAGVGLATYYLAFTFNMMADLFSSMMGGVIGGIIGFILAIVVVVFGHSINLVLTAITGFMHSLRLCFVEFLFKFYEGGGREYSPFRLRKRTSIPVIIST